VAAAVTAVTAVTLEAAAAVEVTTAVTTAVTAAVTQAIFVIFHKLIFQTRSGFLTIPAVKIARSFRHSSIRPPVCYPPYSPPAATFLSLCTAIANGD
jgi:hypothetical protein